MEWCRQDYCYRKRHDEKGTGFWYSHGLARQWAAVFQKWGWLQLKPLSGLLFGFVHGMRLLVHLKQHTSVKAVGWKLELYHQYCYSLMSCNPLWYFCGWCCPHSVKKQHKLLLPSETAAKLWTLSLFHSPSLYVSSFPYFIYFFPFSICLIFK